MRQLTEQQIKNARQNGWEKEALAWAAGDDIESSINGATFWMTTKDPSFYGSHRYRIKQKPVMVKVNRDEILKRLDMIPVGYGQYEVQYIRSMLAAAEVVE